MNNRIYFTAQLQQMAESEVLSMIPSDTLNRIRREDAHPMFKVFSIGHEGDATGANVIGVGSKLVKWARDVVIQMFNNICSGLRVFHGHQPESNAHSGRVEVGEIVGKTMKEINGVLHTLGAVYIKPEFRDRKLDVASLEGTVEFGERMDGNIDVLNVKSITGLAVDDGDRARPAMPGATLQAALQMFTQENEREIQQMELTKEQILDGIAKLRLGVTDLFSEDAIVASEPAKKSKQQEYEHAKRLEKRLGEAREENTKLQGDITKAEGEISKLRETASVSVAKDIFSVVAQEKKLDPKFQKFVEKSLKTFKTDKQGDEFKAEVEKFVDAQAKEYKEQAELYGVKDVKITVDAKDGDGNDQDDNDRDDSGAPSGDKKTKSNNGDKGTPTGDKYTDPKENDFIPE